MNPPNAGPAGSLLACGSHSLLIVPASRNDRYARAAGTGVDAVILDLEDSVAPAAKPQARQHVAAALREASGVPLLVRINHPSSAEFALDVKALVAGGRLAGVCVPKVDGPEDLAPVNSALQEIERAAGVEPGSIIMIPTVESAIGLRSAYDVIRQFPRVRGVCLASAADGDFIESIAARWTPKGEALSYARGRLVCDARAAGLTLVLDGAFQFLDDEAGLAAECETVRNYGFSGKVAIHPKQVPAIQNAFRPSESDVQQAHELIEAFRVAESNGHGVVQHRGSMIDYANVRRARTIIAHAARAKLVA
ncbi:MAG: HpcH/HpaI aldolase [Ramlibacter sp.]|nr:HpcH/HpaI aldolase [Ramlibacter sp.]